MATAASIRQEELQRKNGIGELKSRCLSRESSMLEEHKHDNYHVRPFCQQQSLRLSQHIIRYLDLLERGTAMTP
jgi:hypothetical protein